MTIESSLPYLAPPDLAKAIARKRLTARDQEEAVGWQLSGACLHIDMHKGNPERFEHRWWMLSVVQVIWTPFQAYLCTESRGCHKVKRSQGVKGQGQLLWRVSAVRIRWLTFVKLLVFKCVLWRGRKGRCCVKNTRHAFGSMNRSFHCCDLHLTYVAPAQDAAMSEDLKDGSDPNPTDPKDPMSLSCFRYRGSFNLILSISF